MVDNAASVRTVAGSTAPLLLVLNARNIMHSTLDPLSPLAGWKSLFFQPPRGKVMPQNGSLMSPVAVVVVM
jgi:hypothetical protein